MKKIIAIILFFILGLSIFGLYPLLKVMQYQAKIEMAIRIRNGVSAKDLHEIIFTADQYPNWLKEDREFEFDGHFYDVVEKITAGDSIIYRCLKDTKETRLDQYLKKLAAMNRHHDFQNKDNQKRPTNFYKFQYVSGISYWESSLTILKNNSFSYQQDGNSLCYPPLVPPPRTNSFV